MSNNNQAPAKVEKAQIEAGGAVAAFVPKTLDQAYRLAEALASTGTGMIPKGYEGKPGSVFLAMSKGAELGLAPLAALQTIAAINGRATVWGDALPGLIWRAGHKLDEWLDGDGDKMEAHCKLTRKDGAVIERTFSVADAKKAGLWGKAGPWQQYPKRMLQMRARGFAVRDGAADVMVGLSLREEVMDMPHDPRDVTPRADYTPLAEKLKAKPQEPQSAPETAEEPEPQAEVEEAEVVGPDASQGAPGSAEYDEGVRAFQSGAAYEDNPHEGTAADDWAAGFAGAQRAAADGDLFGAE